ncbi:ABC transporter permease [candidate division KSB1 bacterium]|nr:MAG: ABC transporter permease [candidate division KSB1 bacterium]
MIVKNIVAIFDRELRSYFVSPIAYVVIALFLVIAGFFFYVMLNSFLNYSFRATMQAQYYRMAPPKVNVNMLVIRGMIHNFGLILLFIVPAITMRLFAEEKKSGTSELILTSPITTTQIILGKFFAGMTLLLSMIAPTFLYILIMIIWGNPEILPIFSGYLGLILIGGSFIAVGLFISSLTENQIIAYVGGLVVLLLFWVIGWAGGAGSKIGSVLSYLSLINHLDDFAKGVIDIKHIVYYLSFITFGLFLTYRSIESMKWRG